MMQQTELAMMRNMLETHRKVIAATLCAFVAQNAAAQVHPEKPTYPFEKCYGVAHAGMNDCFTARNSCAGTTVKDNEPDAWIYVPKGTCQRITGGRITPGEVK
jgi:uncharacterized membrane protein